MEQGWLSDCPTCSLRCWLRARAVLAWAVGSIPAGAPRSLQQDAGDDADLSIHIFRQGLYGIGLPGRKIVGEIFPIYFVDVGKQRHITQQDRCLQDMVESNVRFGEDGFEVMHYLVGFSNNVGGLNPSCGRINGYLPGDEQQVAGLYGLAIRPDGGRSIRGIDDLFFHEANITIAYS